MPFHKSYTFHLSEELGTWRKLSYLASIPQLFWQAAAAGKEASTDWLVDTLLLDLLGTVVVTCFKTNIQSILTAACTIRIPELSQATVQLSID